MKTLEARTLHLGEADKMRHGISRMFGRSIEGLGLLFALLLALVTTVVVLVAPGHHWGPEMWPFYLGTAAVLLWVAVDLWRKLRERPADADATPTQALDADIFARDPTAYPGGEMPQDVQQARPLP